jgi:hypothetical protein
MIIKRDQELFITRKLSVQGKNTDKIRRVGIIGRNHFQLTISFSRYHKKIKEKRRKIGIPHHHHLISLLMFA